MNTFLKGTIKWRRASARSMSRSFGSQSTRGERYVIFAAIPTIDPCRHCRGGLALARTTQNSSNTDRLMHQTQLAGGEPPEKRAARGKSGEKQATFKTLFDVAGGDDMDATIDELPAWARTAKSTSSQDTKMREEEQGKTDAEQQASAKSNEGNGNLVAVEDDAASQSLTQPADELPLPRRDENKVKMKDVGKVQQEQEPAAAAATAAAVPQAEQPRAGDGDSVAHVRLFLEDDSKEEPPAPSSLSAVVVREGGKSRAQAMVAAASRLPRAMPAAVPREDSPPPEAADAKALAARER